MVASTPPAPSPAKGYQTSLREAMFQSKLSSRLLDFRGSELRRSPQASPCRLLSSASSPVCSPGAATSTAQSPRLQQLPLEADRELDLPDLRDDYDSSVLDWGYLNVVAIALSTEVWLWNATTCSASPLDPLGPSLDRHVTSLSFSPDGRSIAVARQAGRVQIWDVERGQLVRTLIDPPAASSYRFACIGWNPCVRGLLSLGSNDTDIFNFDLRSGTPSLWYYHGHEQVPDVEHV